MTRGYKRPERSPWIVDGPADLSRLDVLDGLGSRVHEHGFEPGFAWVADAVEAHRTQVKGQASALRSVSRPVFWSLVLVAVTLIAGAPS